VLYQSGLARKHKTTRDVHYWIDKPAFEDLLSQLKKTAKYYGG